MDVEVELDRAREGKPLRERIREWRAANPLPSPTGLQADKAFFDDLSGETGLSSSTVRR
jgi:antitoxin VapB